MSSHKRRRKSDETILFWTVIGAGVLIVGGIPLFVAWLTPGVPPPGPFG